MKKIINIAALIALSICLFSCHKELVIPDPGFDMSETVQDSIRRDTSSVYHIAFNVKAPNGVRSIQLLNGRNFEVIKEFDQYTNQKNFEFNYDFDFSNIDAEQDSMFIYNIKIRTNDNRGYNKSVRILHMRLSHPEIEGPSNTMNIFGRAFVFDGSINTGYYQIEQIKATLNGKETANLSASDLNGATAYRLYQKLTYDFVPGEKYTYNVYVKDSNGQERTFTYNLVGAVLKKPVAFKYQYGTSTPEASSLHYNEQGLLECYFDPWYGSCVIALQYDDEGRLTCVKRCGSNVTTGPGSSNLCIWYQYNEDGSINRFADWGFKGSVNGVDHKPLDPFWNSPDLIPGSCLVADVAGTPFEGHITRITGYNDCSMNVYETHDGKRYISEMTGTGSNHIGPFKYIEDFEEGNMLCGSLIGSSGQGVHPFYGLDFKTRWAEVQSFVPVLNPLYIKDFPTMLHWRYSGVLTVQMLGFKYVASSVIHPRQQSSDGDDVKTIPYTLREDGLLRSFGSIDNYSNKSTLTYYYDDDPEELWKPYLTATYENLLPYLK